MEFQLTGADAAVISSLSPPHREPEQEDGEEEEESRQQRKKGHEDFGDGGDGRVGESAETPVINVSLPEKPAETTK